MRWRMTGAQRTATVAGTTRLSSWARRGRRAHQRLAGARWTPLLVTLQAPASLPVRLALRRRLVSVGPRLAWLRPVLSKLSIVAWLWHA
eukprot:scaffold67_cov338-Prasinococcus_capsulatus_cf.AAC.4